MYKNDFKNNLELIVMQCLDVFTLLLLDPFRRTHVFGLIV